MKGTDNVSVMLALSCQHHYRTKRTHSGVPRKSSLQRSVSHSEPLVVGNYSPRACEMCVCMCNLTVLFLSLMSHQCTQYASAFSELEYINTSADQVILLLQGVDWG